MSGDLIQGSDAWLASRVGKVTASRMADLMARTKSGWGASRANYLAELLCERLTGVQGERFVNAAMAHGTATEPFARQAYTDRTGVDVFEVGFIDHPEIAMSGASPDGYVGRDGLLEIKCPNTATHLDTLLSGVVPEKYVLQMHWQMACAGRAWCDFVSYDPRCPEHLRLFMRRIERDTSLVLQLEAEVSTFLAELDAKIEALNSRYLGKDTARANNPPVVA
jgi:putative phage-type endonuclease